MALQEPRVPGTPSRKAEPAQFEKEIAKACSYWGFTLHSEDDREMSPRDRSKTAEGKCRLALQFCYHKRILDDTLETFQCRAQKLYSGWVDKPDAARNLLPIPQKGQPRPVTNAERSKLLACLTTTAIEYQTSWIRGHPATARSTFNSGSANHSFDQITIPFTLTRTISTDSKRSRAEPFPDLTPNSKKTKKSEAQRPIQMPPPEVPGKSIETGSFSSKSANTSFASEASAVFSMPSFGNSTLYSTQDTVPDDDDDLEILKTQENRQSIHETKHLNSDYASSSFERFVDGMQEKDILTERAHLDDFGEVGQPYSKHQLESLVDSDVAEENLKGQLLGICPQIPACLQNMPLCVIYEITRVFLHVGVPLEEFDAPVSDALRDYDILWSKLKVLPGIENCDLPERCGKDVWAAALNGFQRGPYAVVLGGTFHFNHEGSQPLFRLHLEPMKLDLSYRLGRRFGNDRFLEICIPPLTGKHLPKLLAELGDQGRQIVFDWLIDTPHTLLGRSWKPFSLKPKERRPRTAEVGNEISGADPAFRVYFFAVDGPGFGEDRELIRNPENGKNPKMNVGELLNRVRPTRKNLQEPYLKLFSRTTLALSRTFETLILPKAHIIFKDKNLVYGVNNEVMNDGAGRISPSLALKITLKLGYSYSPSAFQGRLGEAKGLWVVDYTEETGQDWIEVYPSQQKWHRSTKPNGESDDPSHRAFEVLKCSGPLRSADLNLQFLPLLMDRAIDKKEMRHSLAELLRNGLSQKVETIRKAIEDPQSFKQWVRQENANTKERLKNRAVPFRAGLPSSMEERLNVMLDAGFLPTSHLFMSDQTKKLFKGYANELKKRLNIKVGKSTYAYMVPDFWGVLASNEVYIDFSTFVDGVSGFSGALLNGVDVLVARSPAHFVSDIQKVRSVFKEELMGLKDVIVFSTKGNPSLAAKLSGGDYDGDIAWVCWDERIVNNFVNAEVPPSKNLVKEGLLRKDSTTYGELVEGHNNPASIFLKKAFEFNMQPSMLGICTNWKEKVCYAQGNVNSVESQYLSQLLSDLVDAPKQGFTFGSDDWKKFKEARVNVTVYQHRKWQTGEPPERADHIVDYLMCVAERTIDGALKDLHDSLGTPPSYDEDLVAMYWWAREQGVQNREWNIVLDDLLKDLEGIKDQWSTHWRRVPNDETRPEWLAFVVTCYDRFMEITPHTETPFTRSLLWSFCGDDQSQWALLKASAFFASYPRRQVVSPLVWWVAGKQLLKLKSMRNKEGMPHSIIQSMYITSKPDSSMIRRLRSEGYGGLMEETGSVSNVEELEALEDD